MLALSDTITLDTVAPSGTMALNADAAYTTSRDVTVDSAVTGAVEMRKRNIGGAGNWGTWTAYGSSVAHQVSSGDGLKTVEVEYRDAAGNVLGLSDTITLDATAPTGAMALNAGAQYTTSRNVTVDSARDRCGRDAQAQHRRRRQLGRLDGVRGLGAHQVSSGDGLKTVEVEYRDAAGNVLGLSDTITLDAPHRRAASPSTVARPSPTTRS